MNLYLPVTNGLFVLFSLSCHLKWILILDSSFKWSAKFHTPYHWSVHVFDNFISSKLSSSRRSDKCHRRVIKARLHMQLLLRFLVRFSPFDGCERVNQTRMFSWINIYSEYSLLIHSFTSVKRRNSHWKSQQKLQV